MNKQITYMLVIAWLSILFVPNILSAQEGNTLRWQYHNVVVERQSAVSGENLHISMDLSPDETLASTQWIELKITLQAREGDEQIVFKPIYVAGSNRYLQMRRNNSLDNELPDDLQLEQVIQLKDLRNKPLHWEQTLPLEQWMTRADLVIEERVAGCASCERRHDRGVIGSIDEPLFGPDLFEYNYYMPKQVAQKRHEAELVSYVNFRVARHEILPDYKNNPRELQRINDFVNEAFKLTEMGVEVDTVWITGYASPEDLFDRNQALSERRSRSLTEYIRTTHPKLAQEARFRVIGGGEDWAGLRAALVASDKHYTAEVVRIIDKYASDLDRERDIKAMEGGKVYQELLADFYPPLRRSIIKIQYKVPPYTVEQLPEVFGREPELMSHYELCQLAEQQRKAGQQPLEIYKLAYERFGESDMIARLNYATALIEYQPERAEEAIAVLNGEGDYKQSLFVSAMAYQLMGHQAKAEALYKEYKR